MLKAVKIVDWKRRIAEPFYKYFQNDILGRKNIVDVKRGPIIIGQWTNNFYVDSGKIRAFVPSWNFRTLLNDDAQLWKLCTFTLSTPPP